MILTDAEAEERRLDELKDPDEREMVRGWIEKLLAGVPFVMEDGSRDTRFRVGNVHLSRCFNCDKLVIWIHDRMVYPVRGEAPPANPDLPDDIRSDYDEASSILDLSPRGAAALIRLAIQKLCKHLDLPGKNLNKDIGKLVSEGLDPQVQMSLDAVRVIGNNAVHPSKLDLRDDKATAETLFMLLNLIADKLISQPKRVKEVYNRLPEEARQQIDKRNA